MGAAEVDVLQLTEPFGPVQLACRLENDFGISFFLAPGERVYRIARLEPFVRIPGFLVIVAFLPVQAGDPVVEGERDGVQNG